MDDSITFNEPPDKKAKKEKRRSSLGRGRISIGRPSDLNTSAVQTEDVDAAEVMQPTCSHSAGDNNCHDNAGVINPDEAGAINHDDADIAESELQCKLRLLPIYNNRLITEQAEWQKLVDCYQQQADSAKQSANAVIEPSVHEGSDCRCMTMIPNKYVQVLEAQAQLHSDNEEFMLAIDSCNNYAVDAIKSMTSQIRRRYAKNKVKVQHQLDLLNEQTFSGTEEEWCLSFDMDD